MIEKLELNKKHKFKVVSIDKDKFKIILKPEK
jgi:hypothetical protein